MFQEAHQATTRCRKMQVSAPTLNTQLKAADLYSSKRIMETLKTFTRFLLVSGEVSYNHQPAGHLMN